VTARLVLAETADGETVAIGPVYKDESLEELQNLAEEAGWALRGLTRHLTRAGFLGEAFGRPS
jgi:hypothetical protein